MAQMLAGKVTFLGKEFIAEGSAGIRAPFSMDLDNLREVIATLEEWWSNGVCRNTELEEYDRFEAVSDARTIAKLHDTMLESFLAEDWSAFSFLPVEEEFWQVTTFSYGFGRNWFDLGTFEDTHILHALRSFTGDMHAFDLYLKARSADGKEVQQQVKYMMTFECKLKESNDIFVFDGGDWHLAKTSWRDRVTTDVLQLVQTGTALALNGALPKYLAVGEDEYINLAVETLGARAIQLHRSLLGKGLRLELCDILVDERVLLFIKTGKDRKSVDDVCAQATQAALALSEKSGEFLGDANAALAPRGIQLDLQDRQSYTFAILLLVGDRVDKKFSVRAQAAMSNFSNDVAQLGFNCAVLQA